MQLCSWSFPLVNAYPHKIGNKFCLIGAFSLVIKPVYKQSTTKLYTCKYGKVHADILMASIKLFYTFDSIVSCLD